MAGVTRLAGAARMTAAALRRGPRTPGEALLALRIALFVLRLPGDLGRSDVPTFLRRLRGAPRTRTARVDAAVERIRRVSRAVLSLPRLWHRNTCYVRALIFYRFLDAGDRELRLHLGIEQRGPERALHGHAWLTLGDEVLEAPDDVVLAGLREMRLDAAR